MLRNLLARLENFYFISSILFFKSEFFWIVSLTYLPPKVWFLSVSSFASALFYSVLSEPKRSISTLLFCNLILEVILWMPNDIVTSVTFISPIIALIKFTDFRLTLHLFRGYIYYVFCRNKKYRTSQTLVTTQLEPFYLFNRMPLYLSVWRFIFCIYTGCTGFL